MSARALLEQLLAEFPAPPPTFAMSPETYTLLQQQVSERNDRACRWAAGLEALGAKIELDSRVRYGHIVKRPA